MATPTSNPIVLTLMGLSETLAKRSEVVLAFVVIGIVFMMIMPLPTGLVDLLIALNISISALLVVMVMYLPGPVAFSTFPGVLLITTLFRLALSITTTRLILLQADAGNIVEAFGKFVVGGNLVVGVVIFLILLIVNFLVITKGSERVAEVAARFTLDAMPGKQMSIDSDLRAGLLTSQEAQAKRKELAKESQLFGAMDGAMKFVKGDAIAGIIIVLVNILGGVSIGVMQMGMSAGEALEVYAILTIGDGLVAQIPTLLISLTAGLMITRVKDESLGDANVGQEMAKQITAEPKAWLIASLVMLGFSIVPGMPSIAFIVLALIFSGVGGGNLFLAGRKSEFESELNREEFSQKTVVPEEEDIRSFTVYERVSVSLHSQHKDSEWFLYFRRAVRRVRNQIVLEYAYMLPVFKFHFSEDVAEDEFILRFYELPVVKATYSATHAWVKMEHRQKLEELGVAFSEGSSERQEQDLLWINSDDIELLNQHDIGYMSTIDTITERTQKAFMQNGHMFIGLEEAHKIMVWALANIPELAKECERLLPLAKLADVLKKLAAESISLKSLHKIFETIVAHAAVEREPNALTEVVRVYLRDQICSQVAKDNTLNICMLESYTEETLRESLNKTVTGGYFAIDSNTLDYLVAQIAEHTEAFLGNSEPVALVVAQDLRPYIRDLTKGSLFHLPVLSYTEISESLTVKPITRLSL